MLSQPDAKKFRFDHTELDDYRPDVVVTEEQFMEMLDIKRPEVGSIKKTVSKECNHCGYKSKTMLDLFCHVKVHLGELKEQCSVSSCKASFCDKKSLEKHRIDTHGMKIPECPDCFTEFTSYSELYDHLNRHRAHHPFVCSFCSDSFFTLDTYKKHLKGIHKVKYVTDLQIICKTCNTSFYTQDHLLIHRVNMEHNDEDLFTCKVCGFDFETARAFRDHILEHSEEEREMANVAICSTCSKVFFSLSRLRFHIERTHIIRVTDKELLEMDGAASAVDEYKHIHVCVSCSATFDSTEKLHGHMPFCPKKKQQASTGVDANLLGCDNIIQPHTIPTDPQVCFYLLIL